MEQGGRDPSLVRPFPRSVLFFSMPFLFVGLFFSSLVFLVFFFVCLFSCSIILSFAFFFFFFRLLFSFAYSLVRSFGLLIILSFVCSLFRLFCSFLFLFACSLFPPLVYLFYRLLIHSLDYSIICLFPRSFS